MNEVDYLTDLGVDGMAILKSSIKKYDVRLWTEFDRPQNEVQEQWDSVDIVKQLQVLQMAAVFMTSRAVCFIVLYFVLHLSMCIPSGPGLLFKVLSARCNYQNCEVISLESVNIAKFYLVMSSFLCA